MNLDRPTVAFTIGMFNSIDGPAHCVYTQAYGLEMCYDDEWPINTLVMAPPHLVSAMTRQADVTSMGMIAGASYPPPDGDFRQITENDGRWVLARPCDDLARIVKAELGVVLLIETVEALEPLLADELLSERNLIVAFPINSISTLELAAETAAEIKALLTGRKLPAVQVLVSGSFAHDNLLEYARLPNVAGLLLLDAAYDPIIELLQKLAE